MLQQMSLYTCVGVGSVQDIREMTVRHIKYGARAEDVGAFSAAFIDTVERILGDKW